jgi:hypothetical protein
MYKVINFSPDSTPSAMLEQMLNGLCEDGWDLKQIVEVAPGAFMAILSSREQHIQKTSFGPLE